MSSSLEDVLSFHAERGSLAEFGPLSKLAASIAAARESMVSILAAEAAAVEARLEAQRIHPWPLSQSIGGPDDIVVWTRDGRLPSLDTFESDGLRYNFTRPENLYLFVIPSAFVDTIPLREAFGWDHCRARDVLRLFETGGAQALQLIQSPALGLAIFRRLATSSHRNAVAAATIMRNRLIAIGRDPLETALPQASFFRQWQAEDRQADRITEMVRAASPSGVVEALADDPDDVRRALADQQTRDSLAKMQAAEVARQEQADREATASAELLANMAADIAALKSIATNAKEIQ